MPSIEPDDPLATSFEPSSNTSGASRIAQHHPARGFVFEISLRRDGQAAAATGHFETEHGAPVPHRLGRQRWSDRLIGCTLVGSRHGMRTRLSVFAAFVGGVMLVSASGLVEAQQAPRGATAIIKYRQNFMRTIASHMAAIGAVAKREVLFAWHVPEHARAINAMSNMLIQQFPPGSHVGDTRARGEIWQQWDRFMGAVRALDMESARLIAAGTSGDLRALGLQLGNVGRACGGCHEPFRKERQ